MLDLPYAEDSRAEVDMNVVMTGSGRFVEVQGTAEGMAFSRGELDSLLALAEGGIKELSSLQAAALGRATAAAVSGERADPAGAGLGQSGQGGGDRRRPVRRARRRPASRARPRSPTWWRTGPPCSTTPASRRWPWSPPPGWPPWPTTPGWRSTPSGARRVSYSARYAGEDATLRRQRGQAAGRARRPARWRRRPPGPLPHRGPGGLPRRRRGLGRGRGRGRHCPPGPGATAASATTRSSCRRTATAAPLPRCRRPRSTTSRIGVGRSGPWRASDQRAPRSGPGA